MSATTNLGKVSVTPKGAWAITNAYEILDIVTSGGSSYLAKQDVPTGVPLSNTSYWIMIAEKGDGGEVTSASASISGGYGTPGVSVTAGGTAHERTLAFAFTNLRGEKGETGNGIDSVYKTGTSGLVDTYTILFTDGSTYEFEVNNGTASIDDTLTKSGWAADAKVVGDTKASIDGFYETMGVGVADNLTPYSEDSGATQDIPFIAQGTGCGNGESVVDTGSYLQFKKKLGNTVGVNQLYNISYTTAETVNGITFAKSGNILQISGTASANVYKRLQTGITIPSGHKVLVTFLPTEISGLSLYDDSTPRQFSNVGTCRIYESSGAALRFYLSVANGTAISGTLNSYISIRDLSIHFGGTDLIPSDLLAHPENWGRYYAGSLAYNAGTLESADGTVMRSVGRNVWDEEWEQGGIDSSSGLPETDSSRIRSKNLIPSIPGATYYIHGARISWIEYDSNGAYLRAGFAGSFVGADADFTISADAHFIKFFTTATYGGTYKSDITISLYYSGESGYSEYYPYSVLAEVDTGSEVLRSAGAVADEKTPDGTITRRVGYVDMGTLTWNYSSGEFYATITGIKPSTTNILCTKYPRGGSSIDKSIVCVSSILRAYDSTYTDKDTFKTAMSGVYLYYELSTPTTEQGTAYAENIPCDDFGSLMWTQTKGIPQGNEIFYPVDYKASIDTLYNLVNGDMSKIVIDSELGVVADRIPTAPDTDGTYTLKATVSSGTKTYSWVADE